jgi:hypothetical protein
MTSHPSVNSKAVFMFRSSEVALGVFSRSDVLAGGSLMVASAALPSLALAASD